jgi:hypothetical protein
LEAPFFEHNLDGRSKPFYIQGPSRTDPQAGQKLRQSNLHCEALSERLATTFNVGLKASGFVPAFILDGSYPDLWLDGGNRGGSDCSVRFFREVFSTNIRDICVILFLMGSFVMFCTATAYT